jgi:predicted PurR-regulated permease PerM
MPQPYESTPVVRVLAAATNALLLVATFVLTALAALLLGYACWDIVRALLVGENPTPQAVGSISLIIIAFAVMALSKYIAEEEIDRRRELRSPREACRSLTKFMTIVVVAFSLEALVMVFESRRDPAQTLYPTALFAIVVLALVGLGAYQWLSIQVEQSAESMDMEKDDEERSRPDSPHAISARNTTGGGDDDSRDRPGHRNDGA